MQLSASSLQFLAPPTCSISLCCRPALIAQWILPAGCVPVSRARIYSRSTPSSVPPARMATTALTARNACHVFTTQNPLWTRSRAAVLAAFGMPPLSLPACLSVYVALAALTRPSLCSVLSTVFLRANTYNSEIIISAASNFLLSRCQRCESGTFSGSGASECAQCPFGTFRLSDSLLGCQNWLVFCFFQENAKISIKRLKISK